MQAANESLRERLPRWIRNVLILAVFVFAVLLVTKQDDGGSFNPLSVRNVNAEMIAAAPGFLALSVSPGGGNFFIIDTSRQVICVYQLDGEKVRLVSARDFHRDTDIVDSSLVVPGPNNRPIKIEGGSGVDAAAAAAYADGIKKAIDNAEKMNQRRR